MSVQNSESSHAKLLGELGSIGLAEIFETLGTKNRYGWLTLKNKEKEVVLYFQGDLVGLFTLPEEKLGYIPEKLYYSGKINVNQYQTIIESEDPLSTLEELVDSDTILNLLNTIYYDEICYLFSWKEGYFEFVDQKPGNESQQIGKFFEAETVLLDASRRLDENKEVLNVFTNKHEVLVHNIDISDEEAPPLGDPFGNVWHLANYKSFQEVVSFSYLSEFDSAKILGTLYEENQIRFLEDAELQAYANQLEQEQNTMEAEKCYRLLIQRDPLNLEACEALVAYNEANNNTDVLENLYEQIASNFISSEDIEYKTQGAYYLKKYCDLKGDSSAGVEARIHLLDMVINQGISADSVEYDVVKDGKSLFLIFRRQKQDQKAKFVLESLIKVSPDDISVQSELVNTFLDLGDKQQAINQYEIVSQLYQQKNNTVELIATYQKILRLAPNRKDIQQKLDRLNFSKKSKKGLLLKLLAVIICIGLGYGIIYYIDNSVQKTKQEKNNLLSQIKVLIKNDKLRQVKGLIDLNIGGLLDKVEADNFYKQIQNKKDLLLKKIKDEYEKAIIVQQQGDLLEAKKIIEYIQSLDITLNPERLKDINMIYKDIDEKLLYFSNSLVKAKEFEKQGKLKDAITIYSKLWDTSDYKQHPDRNLIKYPIKLNIENSNQASVFVDSKLTTINEEKILYVGPDFEEIQINIPGYTRYVLYNAFNRWGPHQDGKYPLMSAEISIKLKKESLWNYKVAGIIEAAPCYGNGKLYIASKDDNIYTLENLEKSPVESWQSHKPNFLASFSSSPVFFDDVLYIAGNNYTLYAIKKNLVIAKYVLPNKSLISAPAILSIKHKLVFFATENGWVYAMPFIKSPKNWEPKWYKNIGNRRKIALNAYEDDLLISSKVGILYNVDIKSQKLKWRLKISRPSDSMPTIYKDKVYLGGNNTIYACDREKGKGLWQKSIKGRISGELAVNAEGIFFGTSAFMIYCLDHNGEPKWDIRKDDEFQHSPILNNKGIMYIASRNGVVYALDSNTGDTVWKYPMEENITAPPVLVENLLFISAFKTIYTFTDN